MERNEFSSNSTQGQSGGSSAGNNFGTPGTGTGAPGYATDSASTDGQGIADRARDIAGSAQEKLADVGSTVRDRAGTMKDSLADVLETGADKLRQRGGSSTSLAGATGAGSTAIEGDGRLTEVTGKVASGMDATASWLRDADIEGLKSGLEKQVKDHPGRTLLIAAGLGYLLGKAFRK